MSIKLEIAQDKTWLQAETDKPFNQYQNYLGQFLEGGLQFLSEAYPDEICPAIVFELWVDSGRLIMYDSPVGNRLRERSERRYSQLTSISLMDEVMTEGAEVELLVKSVWGALSKEISGKSITALLKESFIKKPKFYAMPYDEFESAFDVESGKKFSVPARNA